jgi:SAM-dependent methyltransferase
MDAQPNVAPPPLARIRPHDWAGAVVVAALVLLVVCLWRGRPAWALLCALVAVGAGVATRTLSVRHPAPMPHRWWWMLLLPRGPLSPARLKLLLRPQPGERILEIGPGIGVYSLPVAADLAPDGQLDALDVQQEMLDHLARRARNGGIDGIVPVLGDAQRLPYPDGIFDAAYLIAVLGEIPDSRAALRELRRILKPGGRLVIGEAALGDPDFTSQRAARELTAAAGFTFERALGPRFAYFALFRAADA